MMHLWCFQACESPSRKGGAAMFTCPNQKRLRSKAVEWASRLELKLSPHCVLLTCPIGQLTFCLKMHMESWLVILSD